VLNDGIVMSLNKSKENCMFIILVEKLFSKYRFPGCSHQIEPDYEGSQLLDTIQMYSIITSKEERGIYGTKS
jgi:hypothetical protein